MYVVLVPLLAHHSRMRFAVSSGPVVHPDERGSRPTHGDEAFEFLNDAVGVDTSFDQDRECFAGVFVDDVQQLHDAAVAGGIELKIQGPHFIDPGGSQQSSRPGGGADTSAFAAPGRYPQAFFAPESLHAFSVDVPTVLAKQCPRFAVPPPGVQSADLTQA